MKKAAVLCFMVLLIVITSCDTGSRGPSNEEEMSAFEQIQRKLIGLQSFRAIATVEYHSNKGVNIYETVQHAKITGEYRIEVTAPAHVAGSVTASDGQQIVQFNTRVNGRVILPVTETPERSEIFLTNFVRNYLQCNEISVSVTNMEEGLRTIFEATVPGSHPYLAISRLWVDNETLLPVKLIVFDQDDAVRIVVTYHVLELNVDLDDGLFTV
ncbi:MAG: hypothetical protein FWC32_14010 [Firmicutes bacterium]|nr:hypothetical protein [Bacillota bacterium]